MSVEQNAFADDQTVKEGGRCRPPLEEMDHEQSGLFKHPPDSRSDARGERGSTKIEQEIKQNEKEHYRIFRGKIVPRE